MKYYNVEIDKDGKIKKIEDASTEAIVEQWQDVLHDMGKAISIHPTKQQELPKHNQLERHEQIWYSGLFVVSTDDQLITTINKAFKNIQDKEEREERC